MRGIHVNCVLLASSAQTKNPCFLVAVWMYFVHEVALNLHLYSMAITQLESMMKLNEINKYAKLVLYGTFCCMFTAFK